MNRIRFWYEDNSETIISVILFSIIFFIFFGFYNLKNYSFSRGEIGLADKTEKVQGKLLKVELKKVMRQWKTGNYFVTHYHISYQYKVDNKRFEFTHVLQEDKKTINWYHQLLQQKIDSLLPIEYATNAPKRSRIMIEKL